MGPGAFAPVENMGSEVPEVDETFCENMLFCRGFKNNMAISAFIAYTSSIRSGRK